ncbi:sterol desaturase family protein [Iodobacter fluviatilis]|jgi:sterol desaturase/sphingolipid hydroxylase (fatty acid hydroxylase superfamily)|nr:sterol desaturase family protein [Iodobacter fluviatilis]
MREYILQTQWHEIMMIGVLFFAALYFGFGTLNLLLSQKWLPAIHYGHVLDPRPLMPAQKRKEIMLSMLTIFLFGTGMVFPWGLLQLGWARLATYAPPIQLGIEIITLIIWNEIHFYINHRLLHTPWLKRFHLPHHRSIITTPWSTYSFHPVEAIMLGNVIMLPMLVHDFSIYSLAAVPIFSIVFNNIGHSNYDFLPDADHDRWWLNGARRHHLHHACYQGNYGFMFPFMDRLLGTTLPADAAKHRIERSRHAL